MSKKLYNNISLFAILKVRNEEEIIQETLDYYADYVDAIYLYDDCSTDRTVEICKKHPKVKGIVEGKEWNPNRFDAEWQCRQAVLELAQKDNPDWLLYIDADEKVEFPNIDLDDYNGVRMQLYDFYITEEDKDKHYSERRWLGPEYREILMMFRNLPGLKYEFKDQREMLLPKDSKIARAGFVKHYGKAISVKQWEDTCEYYSKFWEEPYKSKWEARKGKAIHTKSDFGADLIRWEDKEDCGYPL
jgi:glycosyltransferase involved in cell wall biosynthesis